MTSWLDAALTRSSRGNLAGHERLNRGLERLGEARRDPQRRAELAAFQPGDVVRGESGSLGEVGLREPELLTRAPDGVADRQRELRLGRLAVPGRVGLAASARLHPSTLPHRHAERPGVP